MQNLLGKVLVKLSFLNRIDYDFDSSNTYRHGA